MTGDKPIPQQPSRAAALLSKLNGLNAKESPSLPISDWLAISEPSEKTYNIPEAQDKLRNWMAKALFYLIAGFIASSVVFFVIFPDKYKDLKDLLTIIFSPLITLFGTILGFYFGGKSGSKSD